MLKNVPKPKKNQKSSSDFSSYGNSMGTHRSPDNLYDKVSPAAIFGGTKDEKTIYVSTKGGNRKTKKVIVSIGEKQLEIRKILYPQVKGKNFKTKTIEELASLFGQSIDQHIQKLYPHTHGIEFDLIKNHIITQLQKL